MHKESYEKLNKIRTSVTEEISNQTYLKDIGEVVIKEMEAVKSVIRSFFVNEQESIQKIYSIIKTNSMPWNKINGIDLDLAYHLYIEYFEGFSTFVNKVVSLTDDDTVSVEHVRKTVETAKKVNEEFIHDIFRGEKNPVKEIINTSYGLFLRDIKAQKI